jgi:hypothetical protein
VDLVVNSLVQGLVNYDSIPKLRSRLEEIPTELKKLYKHKMDRRTLRTRYKPVSTYRLYFAAQKCDVSIHFYNE